jgi:hypothetical protein
MQKFKKGDLVRVAKSLGECMSHFTADCDAIVIGSYKDQYGGTNTKSYTIHIKGYGQTSWYYEHQLSLIEANRIDILEQWEKEETEIAKQKSDLDWVFKNGPEVLENTSGSSISALAECIGLTNLWGSHGEGFVYYQNAFFVLSLASKFLETSDKLGWLKFSDEFKAAASMPQENGPKK